MQQILSVRFYEKKTLKAKIIGMTTNGSGIRDTARVLEVSPYTVINEIKKTPLEVNPYWLDKAKAGLLESLEVHIGYSVDMDEF